MLTYRDGETLAHRLDPRSKLAVQVGFAVAVFATTDPVRLAALAVVPLGALAAARLSPLAVVRRYRVLLVILALGPPLAAVSFSPPWVVPERAVRSALSVSRVALLLFVTSAYVVSTPARDSRAAVQRLVPGKPGQLLGVGVGLTVRFLPLVRRDIAQVRTAIRARGGEERSVVDRARRVALVGTRRAFARADRLALALRARCFAWNPTLPALRFRLRDYPVTALGLALAVSPLAPLLGRVVPLVSAVGRFIPIG
jgi:biotin transport system permease protein